MKGPLRRWATDAALTHSVRLGARLLPHVVTQVPGGALTFDDGPHPASTDAVVDALGTTHGAFFLLADRADAHPALVRRVAEAGHTIALHGPAHVDLWRTRFEEPAWADARHRLEDLSGTQVRYVRPPHGHITSALFRFARRADLTVVLWDVMPGDFLRGASADSIAATTRRLSRPNSIVALHDAGSTVAVAVPAVRQLVAERTWGGLSGRLDDSI